MLNNYNAKMRAIQGLNIHLLGGYKNILINEEKEKRLFHSYGTAFFIAQASCPRSMLVHLDYLFVYL